MDEKNPLLRAMDSGAGFVFGGSRINGGDPVQPRLSVIAGSSHVWEHLLAARRVDLQRNQTLGPVVLTPGVGAVGGAFLAGRRFPCNCLLMTCAAVRSEGNVLNNITQHSRETFSCCLRWLANIWSSVLYIYFATVVFF